MTISFDFDGTLDQPVMQKLANGYIEKGIEVIVTTARCKDHKNSDLWKVAEELGIKEVRFACNITKASFMEDVALHFDDNIVDCHEINTKYPGRAVLFGAKMDHEPIIFGQ